MGKARLHSNVVEAIRCVQLLIFVNMGFVLISNAFHEHVVSLQLGAIHTQLSL